MHPLFRAARGDDHDRTLISLIQQGDTAAFEEVVRRYAPALIRYAAQIVRSDDLGQDVVQDVFQRLWERRSELDITGAIVPYLYKMTKYRAVDIMRSRRTMETREAVWVQEAPADEPNHGERAVALSETHAMLEQALRDVPPRVREIFFLVWDHQLSYAEVAAMLEISVPTVRNQMSRAVRHLAGGLEAGALRDLRGT